MNNHNQDNTTENYESGNSTKGKVLANKDIIKPDFLNNNQYLKTLVENALDIIMVLKSDGTIRFLSNSAQHVFGTNPEQVIGLNVINYIHPQERDKFKKRLSALLNDNIETDYSEFKIRPSDGKTRYIESIAKKITDPEGESCIMVNARDITERAKVQDILTKSKQQLSVAQKIAQVGSWEWDLKTNEVRSSKELRRIYGVSSAQSINDYEQFLEYLHTGDREHFDSVLKNAIKEKSTFQAEYRIIRPSGEERKMHAKGEIICNDNDSPVKVIATGQDITDFKKAEHQLLEYSEQLRNYSAKQDMIIENERNQIARDIHDELGQMITVLKMDIFLIKEKVKQEVGEEVAESLNDDLKSIYERFDTLITSVQRITTSLRPEVIDDLGLGDAIKWQCQEFEEQTGIECNYINETENLNDMIKEYRKAIFRIFQQALKNVGEHAEATKAKVKIKLDDDYFSLKVWDNGNGITESKVKHPNSLGLLSMRERSHYLGGELSIEGTPKVGTTVTLKIPVDEIVFKY